MKLLILSDSHGRADNLEAALARHRDASAVLFLGDGIRDLPCTSAPPIYAVRGNCDVYARFDTTPLPDERLECFAGRRLLALHGHTRAAKSGIVRLVDAAMEQDADIVCFGHTHAPLAQYIPAGEIFRGGRAFAGLPGPRRPCIHCRLLRKP